MDCCSEAAEAEAYHLSMAQVSSSSKVMPGEAVGVAEVIDLTCVDSPEFCTSVESSKEKILESKLKQPKSDLETSKMSPIVSELNLSKSAPEGIDVFASQPKTCPFVIELFAGSGRVTAHLKHVGVKASFGVDHKKLSKIAPVQIVDLTTLSGQKLCMQWCESPLLAGVFAAPPCGTCSKAREIILRDSKGRPLPGPRPLRSEACPNGLPFLKPVDRARVSAANRLYAFLSRLVQKLVIKGIPIVIENPRNSLYWLTSFFQSIKHHFSFTAHQACAYGSKRSKWTALAHTHIRFSRINKCCPGVSKRHEHEPWGFKWNGSTKIFATSEEAAYPMELASEIAHAFKDVLQEQNWILEPPGWSHSSFAAMRAITGQQPKASKLPPLVAEHKRCHSC